MVDFWWNKYGDTYKQICKELELTPTKAIHVAFDKDRMCGVDRSKEKGMQDNGVFCQSLAWTSLGMKLPW